MNTSEPAIHSHHDKAYALVLGIVAEQKISEENDLSDDIGIIIGNIQLFGSLRQIELVNKMVNDIGEKQSADLKELINQLRQDIRKELEMEFIPENIDFYKFAKKIE